MGVSRFVVGVAAGMHRWMDSGLKYQFTRNIMLFYLFNVKVLFSIIFCCFLLFVVARLLVLRWMWYLEVPQTTASSAMATTRISVIVVLHFSWHIDLNTWTVNMEWQCQTDSTPAPVAAKVTHTQCERAVATRAAQLTATTKVKTTKSLTKTTSNVRFNRTTNQRNSKANQTNLTN